MNMDSILNQKPRLINIHIILLSNIVGIVIVFGWAGRYMAGALYEAFVDWVVMEKIRALFKSEPDLAPGKSD